MRVRKLLLAGFSIGKISPVTFATITIVLELVIILYWRLKGQFILEITLVPSLGLVFGLAVVLLSRQHATTHTVLAAPPLSVNNLPTTQEGSTLPPSGQVESVIRKESIASKQPDVKLGQIDILDLVTPPLSPSKPESKKRNISYPGTTTIKIPQGFTFPKEGNDPTHSEDKFAIDSDLKRYAVTDGVSRSFLPAKWAEIVATNFVTIQIDFTNKISLIPWLEKCRDEWLEFAQNWVQDAQDNNPYENFGKLIDHGPQTTLVGCSLLLQPDESYRIDVVIVGDAHFFLVREPCSSNWQYEVFPYTSPRQFSSHTETFGTSFRRIEAASEALKIPQPYTAKHGDVIILASDEIAKWILSQARDDADAWYDLFSINSNEKLRDFVEQKLANREMKLDDVTLLIIPL